MNIDSRTNMALSRVTGSNRAIVAMGYDSIENTIVLNRDDGDKLPDPLITGSYDLVWWNLSDHVNPAGDPDVEIVKCIAKVGDTIMVIRSQNGPAYNKNIVGKTYGIVPMPANNIENVSPTISSLSYYNIPQMHGSTYHDATVETTAGATSKVSAHNVTTGVHGVTGSVAGTAGTQTFSSKTLDNTNVITVLDTNFTIQDDAATTKQARFQLSGITAGQTRVVTLQDIDVTMESTVGSAAKVSAHNTPNSVHNFDASGNAPAQAHDNTRHTATYITQSAVDSHATTTTGIHGVGASTVESVSGSTSKVATHASDTTAIHGVGGSTIESVAGSTAKVTAHNVITGVHGVTGSYILGTEDIGVAGGVASLDGTGKVPTSQLPALALTDVYTVGSQAAQLALNTTTQEGDVAIRTDINRSYVRNEGTAGTMADWSELLTPTDAVLSVFGRTGAVTATLASADFANQGTTTSLLHGNASGNPSWGSIVANDIANANVTYAKIQNVSATDKVLGRSTAGAGVVEEITCTAAGRALIDDADTTAMRTTLGLGTLATQSGTFSGSSSGTNTGDQTTITGNAGSATYASNTTITDDTATAATMYPTWVTAVTGNLPQKTSSTKLTFVPSTGTLTATTFVGALTGNVTGNVTGSSGSTTGNAATATTAANATNTAITNDVTTDATMYPTWVTTTTGNLPQRVSIAKLTFNPLTGKLTATELSGALTCPIVSKATGYTATASDHTIVCTAAITITIPTAVGIAGKMYNIKSNIAGTITIMSTVNIDSASTYYMYARYETVTIQSDGAQWWVV